MNFNVLKEYAPLYTNKTRYFLLCGGRGRGGSTAASQFSVISAISKPYFRCAVMRAVLNDVRSSIFQEVKDRLEEQETNADVIDLLIRLNGNTIEGKGFRKSNSGNKAKLKSLANYNCIVVEEAEEVDEMDFDMLDTSIRTMRGDNIIILVFNMPNKNHWIIKRWFNLEKSEVDGYYTPIPKQRDDTTCIYGTYLNNFENLSPQTVSLYEDYKTHNPEYYYTMIRGLVSEGNIGRIYKDWKHITDKEFNELPYASTYGLDFGFSNDPAAFCEVKEHNNKVYARELLYKTNVTNPILMQELRRLGITNAHRIYADLAEPKSIQEFKDAGFNIVGADKGNDSVRFGVKYLQGKEVYLTDTSPNFWKENEEYVWALDVNKNPTDSPVDKFNHLMDALRYNVTMNKSVPVTAVKVTSFKKSL